MQKIINWICKLIKPEINTREEALRLVQPYITKYQQYSIISAKNAEKLLGNTRFEKLVKDKLRGIGPVGSDGFYYWNVVDHLLMKEQDGPQN